MTSDNYALDLPVNQSLEADVANAVQHGNVQAKCTALNSIFQPNPNRKPKEVVSPISDTPGPEDAISVNIETLDGTSFKFDMDQRASIGYLKKAVAKKTGAEPMTQALFVTETDTDYETEEDGALVDSVMLRDLLPTLQYETCTKSQNGKQDADVSSTGIKGALSFCLLLTPTQICVRIYSRVHFLPATSTSTVASIWSQLTDLGACSKSVCEADGELMFMGSLLGREKTLHEAGVIPKPIRPDEHPQYAKRAMALLGKAEIRKSTLHVLIPDKRYM